MCFNYDFSKYEEFLMNENRYVSLKKINENESEEYTSAFRQLKSCHTARMDQPPQRLHRSSVYRCLMKTCARETVYIFLT